MGPVQGPQQLGTRAGTEQGRADAVFAQVSRIRGSTGDKDTKQPKGLLFLSKFGTAPMVLTRLSRNFLFLSIGHPALGSAEENRRCQAFKSFGDRKAQTLKGFAVPRGLWLLHGAHIPYLLPSPRSDSPSCFPFPTVLLTPGQTSP